MENVLEKIEGSFALHSFIQGIVEFTDDEMDIVMSYFTQTHLPAGEYFVDEGLICDQIGFITKGYVRCFYEIQDTEVTTMILSKHNIVTSHTSFAQQQPSVISIEAISDCDLLTISHGNMEELYNRFPKWERLGRLITEQVYGFMERRVIDYLSLNPEARYRKMIAESPKMLKNVPLRYIASMLGITPETLSRIRNKVKKAKG